MRRACLQEPAADGVRYTRWLIVRQTYQVLASATIETARGALGSVLTIRESAPPTARARFAMSDGTQVDTEFEFLAIDSPDSMSKLLGYEMTGALLDEISEMPEAIVHAVLRRIGRFPSNQFGKPTWTGIIGVTNGPIEGHWLQKWEMGVNRELLADIEREMNAAAGTDRPIFHAFAQPPALIRPHEKDGKWLTNPAAENVHNLPGGYGYYYKMLLDPDDAKIKAYVEGDFAPIKTGKVVFPEFNRKAHVIPYEEFNVPHGAPLGMSFDFGRTPVCTLYMTTAAGGLVQIEEFMGEDMSVQALAREKILPVLKEKYRFSRIGWATGDPAGEVRGQNVDLSPYEVLQELGIPIESPGANNRMEPRLEAVKQRLTTTEQGSIPMLRIRGNCKMTIDAMERGYIYERRSKNSDEVSDNPTKSHLNWVSDLADSIQYACLYNPMSFAREKYTKPLPKLDHRWA